MSKIAILGLGTVGTGVAKVVAENARQIERKLGEPLTVKSILVRHFKDSPYRQLMIDDFSRIERDSEIRVVVETIGGVDAAYDYTRRALEAGKHGANGYAVDIRSHNGGGYVKGGAYGKTGLRERKILQNGMGECF